MNLITAKLEISNARLAARVTADTIGGPPVSPSVVPPTSAASTTSRIAVDHKLRLLLMYVMAAVRVRDVPGAGHLADKIGPGIHKSLEEKLAELLRFLGRQWQRCRPRRKA